MVTELFGHAVSLGRVEITTGPCVETTVFHSKTHTTNTRTHYGHHIRMDIEADPKYISIHFGTTAPSASSYPTTSPTTSKPRSNSLAKSDPETWLSHVILAQFTTLKHTTVQTIQVERQAIESASLVPVVSLINGGEQIKFTWREVRKTEEVPLPDMFKCAREGVEPKLYLDTGRALLGELILPVDLLPAFH
ncbi:hypothetical protein HDV00_000309 [Rhizophlyctis rosea]|nr:hypothetical protein HDV00_000309 [Rhizophlyctis rosea]